MSDLSWRLIPFLPASGQVQMAIDRWLLGQHCLGLHPPTLRFYTWSPVAISLGYHQRRYPDFWQRLVWEDQPIDLVRRPSGGRAVLHQGDLTYAVVASGISGDRLQAYQTICEFLIQGWQKLDVKLHYGQAGRGYIHNPNCFGTATGADLVTSSGEKFIGSAQMRQGTTILQHGSMRLYPDPQLSQQVFGVQIEPPLLPTHLSHLSQEALMQIVMETLTASASEHFGVELVAQPLTDQEWQAVLAQVSVSIV